MLLAAVQSMVRFALGALDHEGVLGAAAGGLGRRPGGQGAALADEGFAVVDAGLDQILAGKIVDGY